MRNFRVWVLLNSEFTDWPVRPLWASRNRFWMKSGHQSAIRTSQWSRRSSIHNSVLSRRVTGCTYYGSTGILPLINLQGPAWEIPKAHEGDKIHPFLLVWLLNESTRYHGSFRSVDLYMEVVYVDGFIWSQIVFKICGRSPFQCLITIWLICVGTGMLM